DAAGNTSAASTPFNITIDTSAPNVPVVSGISEDTNIDGDGITSDNTLSFNGTAEAGSEVEVFVGNVSIGTTTANADGNWFFDHTGTEMADGDYAITATATDAAGNTSAASTPLNITIDTSAPNAPVVNGFSEDTNIDGDGITSDNTLSFNGTAEAGSVVEVFVDNVSIGTTTANTDGTWVFDHTGTEMADGDFAITATATDAAGNVSAASTPLNITIDTSAPNAPIVSGISEDTNIDGDGITSDKSLTFNGTAEAGSKVEVFVNGTSIGTTTANTDGNWTFDHTGTQLADGDYDITATATDAAGNTSAASTPLDITIDTSAPSAPVVSGISEDINIDDDGITSDNTLTFNGTAEAGSEVEVFVDNVSVGTTTTNTDGIWTFDHTGTQLVDGDYAITATATDAAGNVSAASTPLNITIDTSAPNAPVVSGISEDTNIDDDGITSDNTLTFNGTAEAGSKVEVFVNGTIIGTTTANTDGNWTFDNTGTQLPDGDYDITATAIDAAGNVSAISAPLNITIDTTAPNAPVVSGISKDTNVDGDGITSDNTLTFNGTAEAGSDIEVFVNGVSVGTTTADVDGNWTFDHTGTQLADGNYDITATATGAAGNISAASTPLDITIDTSAPNAPVVSGITEDTNIVGDGITSDNTLTFNGTAEAGSVVEVFVNNVSIGTTTADVDGNWTFDHSGTQLVDGDFAITATATDA
ncbi:Ig-like domain-containing protein, partial [Sulfitobacter sp.]|uniref:Ig-like domain-containing protein n=1 Tax=Sulfitobacter sp. TaxID=1903071 RepID=UPI00356A1300